MPQDPFSQSKWSDQNQSLGTGEGESPLMTPGTPSPKIDVRTMASDIKSTQESGGGTPHPYTPPPPPVKTENINAESSNLRIEQKPADKKPNDSIFRPPEAPVTPAPTIISKTFPGGQLKSKKKTLLWIIIAVVVIGLVTLGYFVLYPVLYPMFFPKSPIVVENSIPTPIIPAPTPEPEPAPIPIEIQPIPEPLITHTSLFKETADLTTEISLPSLSLQDLKASIEFATADVPILKEIVLKDSNNNLVNAEKIMGLFDSSTFSSPAMQNFDQDPTIFSYTNNQGTWLGIVLKLSSSASINAVKTDINKIETNNNATNFFLTDPGKSSTWKDGKVNNYQARYIGFLKTGAALSYAWVNDQFLLISTNYAGAQEATKLLGF
ncbi:MAG: hypothetical protein QMD65_00270 [Patescibacteria group bacterium]|nr:hypothetical protein [Patescibacteria group bacterium]